MNRIKVTIPAKAVITLILTFVLSLQVWAQESSLAGLLKAMPGVLEVKAMKCRPPFTEKYLIRVKQYLDPSDTSAGWFSQRVFLSHRNFDAPMVFVTEGYTGSYAEDPGYTEELAEMYATNQVLVEHRYFEESVPVGCNWKYLTTTAAAADHHRVRTMLAKIYTGKWIATGISKGGETALIYRTLYPNDVDITVCYVAPLSFGVEDGRHEPFICCSVASASDREKIYSFQTEVLKRRNKILPLLKKHCEEKKYTFNIPLPEVLDYCVLEFSFSFWQWGWKISSIPSASASDQDHFQFLIRVCSPDYFANEGIQPTQAFFVQAAKELGYYGYETSPFAKYLKIKSAKGYLDRIFLPKGFTYTFDPAISQKCASYLRDNDPAMIFIYGGYDPWTAAAVDFSGKTNLYKAVCPGGSHATRIGSLPKEMKDEIDKRISRWLKP